MVNVVVEWPLLKISFEIFWPLFFEKMATSLVWVCQYTKVRMVSRQKNSQKLRVSIWQHHQFSTFSYFLFWFMIVFNWKKLIRKYYNFTIYTYSFLLRDILIKFGLLSKCQNHEEDFFKFGVFLRKSEL